MGFVGFRCTAARHIVPDRASHAPIWLPYLFRSVPFYSYPDRLAIFGIMCLIFGTAAGACQNLRDHVSSSYMLDLQDRLHKSYINRSKNV